MKQQFKLGDSVIDMSRNQITRNGQDEVLPPKALAVLHYLAEQQGKVVSHETIMTAVWTNTIVSPNTLQRCITQLRKALGDDGKNQSIIQTHSKQGYSLECPVTWLTPTQPKKAQTSIPPKKLNNLLAVLAGIMAVMVLGFVSFKDKQPALSFNHLTQVTATDAKESGANYTTDGRYIIFHRFAGLCKNNLWAKDLITGQEIQLTEKYGLFRDNSYSVDGKQLVFMAREDCQRIPDQPKCWNLMSLDLTVALISPQVPKLRVSCDIGELDKPYWLNNGNIAVLHKQSNRWTLVQFSPDSTTPVELYSADDKQLYSFTYSAKRNQMALIGIDEQGRHVLDILGENGQLISSATIKRPSTISTYQFIHPSFDPKREQLIFSTGRRLFALTFNGEISQLPSAINQPIYSPNFHPNLDKLVASYGVMDSDIALLDTTNQPIDTQAKGFNEVNTPYPSIARSVFNDRDGRFQPNGDSIAFTSERSGTNQLWLTNEQTTRQLTQFDIDTTLGGFDWNIDGSALYIVARGVLHQISLNKSIQTMPLPYEVTKLFHRSNQDSLLLEVNDKGNAKVVLYNIKDASIKPLLDTSVRHAAISSDSQLIYLDQYNRYWQQASGNSQQITGIDGPSSDQQFIIEQNIIYSTNNNNELWSYDLTNKRLQTVTTLAHRISYISDKRDQQVLVNQMISFKKEIVELSHSM